jgi:hypothetical protein
VHRQLKRRDELFPVLRKWSPDYLLHEDAAPMFFENEWGLTKPDGIRQNNYDVHSPAWALGFQKFALAAGATCFVKVPGHPADGNRSRAGEQRGGGLVTEVGFHGRCQVGKDRAAL